MISWSHCVRAAMVSFLILCSSVLLPGCRSISSADLALAAFREPLLPSLELHVVESGSLKMDAPFAGKEDYFGIQPGIFALMPDSMMMQVALPDELRAETRLLAVSCLENRLYAKPAATDDPVGYAVIHVLNRQMEDDVSWCFYTALTFFAGNLLGMPFAANEWTVELKLDVLDRNLNLIHQVRQKATGKAYCALYWGYDQFQMRELAHAKALKNGLDGILAQVESSAPAIREKLGKAE